MKDEADDREYRSREWSDDIQSQGSSTKVVKWRNGRTRNQPAGKTRLERKVENLATSDESEGCEYCSRSEAICAELLKRFIPHFSIEPGLTFQVEIGFDKHGNALAVDFLVDGVLVEYHPVRFHKSKRRCGDFRDSDEHRSYTRIFHSLKQSENREFMHEVMKSRLAENYFRKRRSLLDQHPLFRRTELIVAHSPEDFYYKVIRRFGKEFPVSCTDFCNLFAELQYTLGEGPRRKKL